MKFYNLQWVYKLVFFPSFDFYIFNFFLSPELATENRMVVFKNLKIEQPDDPAISLINIYPKELKAGTRADICALVFIAALCTLQKVETTEMSINNR